MSIATRGSLELEYLYDDEPGVFLQRCDDTDSPAEERECVVLSPDELRWLIHTGGPAALAALRKDETG